MKLFAPLLLLLLLLLGACVLTAQPGFIVLRYDVPGSTLEPTPTSEPAYACNRNDYGVNLRVAPATTGALAGVLLPGQCLPLANDISSWWIVWYQGRTVYAAGWLLNHE